MAPFEPASGNQQGGNGQPGPASSSFESSFSDAAAQQQVQPQTQPAVPQESTVSQPPAPQPAAPAQPAIQQQPAAQPAPQPAPAAPAQPAAPAPQASAAQQNAPPPNALVQQATDLGLQIDADSSNEQVAQAVLEQLRSITPYAQYGQSMLAQPQQPAKPEQTQPTEPQPKEWSAESYFDSKWDTPAWDPQFDFAIKNGMVVQGQNGLWEAATGYETMAMPILNQLNQAHVAQRDQWSSIVNGNPYQKFFDVLQEPMQRAWQKDIRSTVDELLAERQSEQSLTKFAEDNASWMFTVDQRTGQRVPTQPGQTFLSEINRLEQAGVSDPSVLLELAQRLAPQGEGTPLQQGAPQQPNQTPAIPNQQSPPAIPMQGVPAASPQTSNAQHQSSFLQNALAAAAHSPQAGAQTVQAGEPVVMSEGELQDTFASAQRSGTAV